MTFPTTEINNEFITESKFEANTSCYHKLETWSYSN